MCTDRVPKGNGFTLFEVVVALAIAGLVLVGFFRAGSGGLLSVDTAAKVEEAVERAQSHLAAVGRDAALGVGDFTGDDGAGYRWTLRIRPLSARQSLGQDGVSSITTTLFSVEVVISWPAHAGERSVALRTLRLGTGGSGG